MKQRYFLLILTLIVTHAAHGQMFLYSDLPFKNLQYNTDSTALPFKKPWNAVGGVVGINLSVWGFDRYFLNADFARISPATMRANFKKGFVWDNDFFSTNLVMHPYHGGLYFNTARSNGLNYWQSLPFTLGGSLMWEFLMEKEYPSINDLIATSVGGTGFGEVTFRLSDRMIDDRARGWNRLGREIATFALSPARGMSRVLSGQAWKHKRTRGNVLALTPVNGYAEIGYRNLIDDGKNNDDVSSMAALGFGFLYGTPYDGENSRPYDFFSANFSINLFSNQPIISKVKIMGMLYSNHIKLKTDEHELSWGLFQHFNYFESKSDSNNITLVPYKLSEAASIGPGLLYKRPLWRHCMLFASAYSSIIFLGSSQSDHYNVNNRDYNLGSGFSIKTNLELLINKRITLRLNTEDYRIYTWLGSDLSNPNGLGGSSQGDRSKASLSHGTFNFNYRIHKGLYFGIESGFLYRSTDYKYYPTVEHKVTDNKLTLGFLI